MLIPTGHEGMQARRWPFITIGLIILNVAIFLVTNSTLQQESVELSETRKHICLLAAMHPEVTLAPTAQKLVDDIRKREPSAWIMAKSPHRPLEDGWDARARLMEEPEQWQAEMDRLTARYDELRDDSVLEKYAFVPIHPHWYSYISASFMHGGWLHLIGNMWFLWLAGIILEDSWGRPLYLVVYLLAGAFAMLMHSWFHSASYIATLGASGSVAGLMGAFLMRFPKVRIRMLWLWGFFRVTRFSSPAYWLLPGWFLMEIFSGALFGSISGVAHMAHVGGFLFGMAAATAIRYSGLEHSINAAIEQQLDPEREAELDHVEDLINENELDQALGQLELYVAGHPNSERALLSLQDIHWRRQDLPAYGEAAQKLCELHLSQHDFERALKDYQDLVETAGGVLKADTWLKLGKALEEQQEFERALGEYQELAEAYPKERQSLMALMAGARLAMNKLQRPQQALMLYQAAAASPIPHLDLDVSIEQGSKAAQTAMTAAAAAGS